MFRHEKITAEGIADELVAWVDAQPTTDGRVQHLVFVIDEMGAFIGDSTERIGELNSLAEMLANKGKGRVWLIVTSQQDLEKVVDRTNFQPALVGRLNARFDLKPHLISDEIDKVVAERILKKRPAQEPALCALYQAHEGAAAQLADVKASRQLGTVSERTFVDCYPFLPHQIRLAQDIFEAISGFRISGGVRSMISVVMESIAGRRRRGARRRRRLRPGLRRRRERPAVAGVPRRFGRTRDPRFRRAGAGHAHRPRTGPQGPVAAAADHLGPPRAGDPREAAGARARR